MKRKEPNIISMEDMTQDLLNKAYSCEISKEQLLKMFSDCIEKKWMKEEEKFRKKVEVYLGKNQHYIESYEADFYDDGFEYKVTDEEESYNLSRVAEDGEKYRLNE